MKGFTLIELLVVVLIIGILAAVALPQYEFAVKKARWAMLPGIFRKAMTAQRLYYIANGCYAHSWEDLDVLENWTLETNSKVAVSPDKKIKCSLYPTWTEESTHIKCWPAGYNEYYFAVAQYYTEKEAYCWNHTTFEARMCQAWGWRNCPVQDSERGFCKENLGV